MGREMCETRAYNIETAKTLPPHGARHDNNNNDSDKVNYRILVRVVDDDDDKQ